MQSNHYHSRLMLIYLLHAIFTICYTASSPDSNSRYTVGQHISYKSNNKYVLTLETDSQVKADSESIQLRFRTSQNENSVIAVGRTNEQSFKIELSEGRLVFHFTDDNDLSISSYSLPENHLNDGNWHSLIVQRNKSKFKISIDGLKYSEIVFNKPLIENVFAGSRITLGFENDIHTMLKFKGEITEVIISLNNIPLRIKELPIPYSEIYNEANVNGQNSGIDKVIIRVDMAPGSSVYLRPHDSPLTLLYNDEKHVDSFGVSFQTSTDGIIASLLGSKSRNLIGFEVVDRRLFIIVKNGYSDQSSQSLQRKELGNTDYNTEYTVHLRNDRQGDLGVISAWLTSNRESPVSFKVNDPFLIDKISFGGEIVKDSVVFINSNPISGCIKKPYLNLFTLNLKPLLDAGRSDCSDKYYRLSTGQLQRRLIDHVEAITFRYGDRPLPFTYAENDRKQFKSLELDFATLEMSGIIASLHDNKDNFMAVFISEGLLYMIIDDKNIEQQSFKISDKLVNDGQYHRLRIVNTLATDEHDYTELDSYKTRFPKMLSSDFYLTTVYFAAADFWAKDHYSLGSIGNFFGCMKNILFNGEHIIRYDHVLDKSRINAGCQPIVSKPIPSITYLKPDISFSCKKQTDIVNIQLSNSEEFNSLMIPLNTFIIDGVIATLSSTFDQKSIVLYVQSGGLNLAYLDNSGKELHLTTGKLINDGSQHKILLKREPILGRVVLSINDQTYNVNIPVGSSPLFFDKLTIGGTGNTLRFMPQQHSGPYQGCFQHIEYNKASVVPNSAISKERQKCSVINKSVCDVENHFCLGKNQQFRNVEHVSSIDFVQSTVIPKFCSSLRCSVLCQPNDRSLVSIRRPLHASLQQKIAIVLRTNNYNSQLFKTTGITGVAMSVNTKNGHLVLEIETSGRRIALDFPPHNIADANHHTIVISRHQNQINLTLDEHTTVHSVKSLLKKKLVFDDHTVCTGRSQGYIEDVIFSIDSRGISILDEIVNNPKSAQIGSNAVWENRHSLRQREKRMAPCTTLNCGHGEIECRVKETEINYKVSSTTKVCTCVDPMTIASNIYCEAREDSCAQKECIHGTCVIENSNAVCHCSSGYTGERCDQQVNPCTHSPCQNGGMCYPQGPTSFYCHCSADYTGRYCESPVILDPCQNVHCQNGGRCINGQCQCPSEFTGQFCEQSIDLCRHVACQNGGQCVQGSCHCPSSFSGTYCEITDPCYNVQCLNDGVCEYGRCRCRDPYFGDYCEQYDRCYQVECFHDGKCVDGQCSCPTNWKGKYCEIEDTAPDPCVEKTCLNDGICEHGKCQCVNGYFGDLCEERDPCFGIDCKEGHCVDGQCECTAGYYGDFCNTVDLCVAISCLNRGQCSEGKCVCEDGFFGANCEKAIDPCLGVKCLHGHCINGVCQCDPGYEGAHCDTIVPIIPPAWGSRDPLQGGLIEYGRVPRRRGKHLGTIFAIASGLALGALAGAFAARKCAEGACTPIPSALVTTIPVTTGGSSDHISTMIDRTVPTVFTATNAAIARGATSHHRTEDEQLLLPNITDRSHLTGAAADAGQSERIETIHERLVEAQLLNDANAMTAGGVSFAYQPPPIGDFGYEPAISQQIGYSDAESWEVGNQMGGTSLGAGTNNLQMNAMGGGIGGVDYELSNINTLTMTPNGKYTIVGQSQGPPQIWDAQNGNLINSLYGNCNNCMQLALACNGSLLVGLSSDITDTQPCIVQIWDINTGRPIHLSHQIKCSAFTLSNNTNNIIMAGNQKYGRGISVGILDLVSNELTKELKSDTQTNLGRDPSFIALTPDECYAVIGCYSQAQSMTNYVVFDLTAPVDVLQPPCISLDCDPKRCIVLNNKECISGINNGQLFIWDIFTCKPVHYFCDSNLDRVAHRSQINDLKLSADKSLLITASKDGTAKIWDTVGRNLLTRLLGHHSEVKCACIANNQSLAVTGASDYSICLWRLPSGQMAAQMNVGMVPIEVHLASENRTVISIAEKDDERQLLMLRVVSCPTLQSTQR